MAYEPKNYGGNGDVKMHENYGGNGDVKMHESCSGSGDVKMHENCSAAEARKCRRKRRRMGPGNG